MYKLLLMLSHDKLTQFRNLKIFVDRRVGSNPPLCGKTMIYFEEEIRRGWITCGHSELWGNEGTYMKIPYEFLPAIPADVDRDFSWLEEEKKCPGWPLKWNENGESPMIGDLISRAAERDIVIPPSVVRFFSNASIHEVIPTMTACYLDFSKDLLEIPGYEKQFLFRFLNDSQVCYAWYLLFQPGKPVRVTVSDYLLDPELFEEMHYCGVHSREAAFADTLFCAHTFNQFVYRFWIENMIWESLHGYKDITAVEEDYLRVAMERAGNS